MTITERNKQVYQAIYQHKALTEQILGITNHSFPFVKARYKAVCTEAIDFTMFDKVICGILQIDEVLSFEEIADILGLNVVNRPEESRYIDYGEKEILEFALNSLIEFQMIETGDIYHSRCRLTEIGKEYAAKGKKFLPATEKEFEIYFDLTDKNHKKAKKRFGNIETASTHEQDLDLDIENEPFVKEVAKTQIPEIYNPEQLRNFTNLQLKSSKVYSPEFFIVALVSFVDSSVRFLAFDDKQETHHPITEIINSDEGIRAEILENFELSISESNGKSDIQKSNETEAIKAQNEIQKLLSDKKVEEAFEKSKAFYLESEMIDEAFLELNLENVFDKESREFWMILSDINEYTFSKIKTIISKKLKPENNLILITRQDIPIEYNEFFTECSKKNPCVFFGVAEEIDQSIFLSKKGRNKWSFTKQPILTEFQNGNDKKNIEKHAYFKSEGWNAEIFNLYKNIKQLLAEKYCLIVFDEVQIKFKKLLENIEQLSKQKIDEFELYVNKVRIFKSEKEHIEWINDFLKSAKDNIEAKLKLPLKQRLDKSIIDLEKKINNEEAKYSISELREFQDKLEHINSNLFEENKDVKIKTDELKEVLNNKIQTLSNSNKKSKPQRRKPHRSTNKKR